MKVQQSVVGSFGEEHFGAACLGDVRRTQRLVKTADLIVQHPQGSLCDKLKDWSDLMGLYRLLQQPAVTHAAVLEPHRQRTRQVMAQTPVVLLLSDSTELDYSGHLALEGLGQIGNGGGWGLICHNTLAITPERQVLGLPSQILHVRRQVPKDETPKQKREHPQRESLLWLRGCEAVGQAPSDSQSLWVDIGDRGADTFEFLDYEQGQRRHYVIRSAKDRKLAGEDHVGADRIYQTLRAYVRDLPVLGVRALQVHANRGRHEQAGRETQVTVSAGPVTIQLPQYARGFCHRSELSLWAIAVREIHPRAGTEALEWILLTNLPTESLAQACERLGWYESRIVVEEFHRALKSGMGVEQLRLETRERLEPAIALLSVTAAMLLDLRQMGRSPEAERTPATAQVPKLWVQVLSGWRYKQVREDLSVREFYLALGKLGGHLNRKGDGFPGWQTLWRGWQELQLMVQGAMAIQRKRCV